MKSNPRLGATNKATNGQLMTIIAYRGCKDIDVRFEDGTVVCHRSYYCFLKGWITNPNYDHKGSFVGKQGRANNGLMMTIIAYRRSDDIDIQFEDGTIVTGTNYTAFCKGAIGHPAYNTQVLHARATHLGESIKANNGMMMTIIAYRGYGDIDVQFEDGYIAEHRNYSNFITGDVLNPNCKAAKHQSFVGQQIRAKNGLMMTIVAYRGSMDIDILFEDGYLATHKQYAAFQAGEILNPNVQCANGKMNLATQRTGMHRLANCGVQMTITEYRGATNMRVDCDSGYHVDHHKFQSFQEGRLLHPFPWMIGKMSMDKPAYILNDTGNFYCHCTKCGIEDIMSIAEMKDHKCIAK